ncbi:hypothetical protein [Salisediminibacterium halotolerans]|nr:hypothetical protein [Salisediminibacterium haloalkalitolerans]
MTLLNINLFKDRMTTHYPAYVLRASAGVLGSSSSFQTARFP